MQDSKLEIEDNGTVTHTASDGTITVIAMPSTYDTPHCKACLTLFVLEWVIIDGGAWKKLQQPTKVREYRNQMVIQAAMLDEPNPISVCPFCSSLILETIDPKMIDDFGDDWMCDPEAERQEAEFSFTIKGDGSELEPYKVIEDAPAAQLPLYGEMDEATVHDEGDRFA